MTINLLEPKTATNTKHVPVSGKLGTLETRLAQNADEVKAAQETRYRVFCDEMSATPNTISALTRREQDAHDARCDHLLVIDRDKQGAQKIVGTQRFLVKSGSSPADTFYSSGEFDISNLLAANGRKTFMELGRSCILPDYRNKRTMELLWHGTWDYALKHKVDFMFGCASFPTRDAQTIAGPLKFLAMNCPADPSWQIRPTASDAIDIASMQASIDDPKKIIRSLPPLIRGYLRLGAMFSGHAVFDPQFGTIDILVVLPIERINQKFISHYGEKADRHSVQ